ncbi:hypothetical protein BJV82DRAFT_674137 [Fennellomyces sp. T-0311]|nr:hypothetical protein BJV82DRAFT_674137 [Fennellomyces sp. T-0311]
MPRFWSRVLHRFRHHKKHSSPATTDATPSLDYSLSSCLTESAIYREDLVKVDTLQLALQDGMEAFFCGWNEELERVYEKCRWALDSLTCTIDEFSHEICIIASPLQNPDRESVHHAHQFISSYLKEWQQHHQHDLSKETKPPFDAYFESLQAKVLAAEDPRLSHCIQQMCQWEHDFFLYKQYFDSQMAILWEASRYHESVQRLLQTRWDRRYKQCLATSQALQDKIKTLLEQSSPSRDDFTCAICLSVLSEPVTIGSCLHTFCRPCIQHLYCTCTSTSCSSPCHRATRRQEQRRYRRRHSSLSYSKKKQKLLSCQCYRDTPLPKQHSCPLCRTHFTLQDCTMNIALDNFISLYFPYEENADDNVDEGQGRRRSAIYTAVQQLWTPIREHPDEASVAQEPQPRRHRYERRTVRPESTADGYDTLNRDLYNLARRSWWF